MIFSMLLLALAGAPAGADTATDPSWIRYLEGRLRLSPDDAEIRSALRRARPAAPAVRATPATPATPAVREVPETREVATPPPPSPPPALPFDRWTLRERLRAYARGETRRSRAGWNPGRELLDAGLVAQARLFLRVPDSPASAPPVPAPIVSASVSAPVSPPDEPDTFSRRVDLLLARGDVAGARAVVARWREAEPENPAARANARILLGERRAKERIKRDLVLFPLADDTLPILLRDALRAADTTSIRALARRWRAARPASAEAWALIGLSFRRLGEEDAARAAWRRSLEIDPDQHDLAALVGSE